MKIRKNSKFIIGSEHVVQPEYKKVEKMIHKSRNSIFEEQL